MPPLPPNKALEEQARIYLKMEHSIIFSVAHIWGLVPQPVKSEYQARFSLGLKLNHENWDRFIKTVTKDWFEPYQDGLHLTWQQSLVFYGIDKALKNEASTRISIVSGHGIGKSMMLSIIILWFLFIHPDCQIACTSPGQQQLYDVLWKELKKWIDKMPQGMSSLFVWESSHIRMKESPETWFARAKTASKENTEALAGVHADHVLIAADEASGVEEPIYETMEGALTSGNILVFLISNGTRSNGYFYDTHHKDKARWQNYSFSSLDSPRVDQKYVNAIVEKYGADSVQYAIRVEGRFPDTGIVDEKGYVQLFSESDLHFVPYDHNWVPVGRAICGVDASGEGQDSTQWAIRDRQRAGIVASEQQSTSASMATKTLTICDKFRVDPIDTVIDAFGSGHAISQEIALATSGNTKRTPWRVTPLNVGEPCDDPYDKELYINKRAEAFYKMMLWARAGGEFMETDRLKDELFSIRYKRTANGRIQIMSKVEMAKLGYPSPNMADALSLTFLRPDGMRIIDSQNISRSEDFDPHSPV